jgi:predicted O-methyltransferase YrrM
MGAVAVMQIAPEQGALMALIAKLIGARRYIEVGTFTGYSALAVALAMPDEGRVEALDISEEYIGMARRYWTEAGQSRKIAAHVGPALETMDRLLREGLAGAYDYGFIDADKSSYDDYYERLLKLLRPGGVIAIDNVLWFGRVADPTDDSADTAALRALNAKIRDDARVDIALLPVADGIFLCRKR